MKSLHIFYFVKMKLIDYIYIYVWMCINLQVTSKISWQLLVNINV